MIRMLLKRHLFCLWDNALVVFTANALVIMVFFALLVAFPKVPDLFAGHLLSVSLTLWIAIALLLWVCFCTGALLVRVFDKKEIPATPQLKRLVLVSVMLALPVTGGLLASDAGTLGFDLSTSPIIGVAVVSFLVMASMLVCLLATWFLVFVATSRSPGRQCAWQAGLMVFDNPGFALLYPLFWLTLSVFTFGLMPGPVGLVALLGDGGALRLRCYHEGRDKRSDWRKLLEAEYDQTERRTLRSLVFPWRQV